jgi:hypothetical protein
MTASYLCVPCLFLKAGSMYLHTKPSWGRIYTMHVLLYCNTVFILVPLYFINIHINIFRISKPVVITISKGDKLSQIIHCLFQILDPTAERGHVPVLFKARL